MLRVEVIFFIFTIGIDLAKKSLNKSKKCPKFFKKQLIAYLENIYKNFCCTYLEKKEKYYWKLS